jgi:tetratricopeptide (TPR) repeat protein
VKFLGSDNPKVADTEGNLGETYCEMGNFKQAIIHYEEGVKIYKYYFGTEHIATAGIMEELARVYHTLGEYDLAMKLYKQVLWNKRNLTELQIETGDTLHNTAITLQSIGQHDLAKEFFQQALAIYQFFQDSRREANTIKNIGITYSHQRNYTKAVDCFRETLEIENREYGLENPNTANTFSNLAATFGQVGKYNESIQLSQMALDITKRFRAPTNVDIGDMHHNIAVVKLRRGDTRIADVRAHLGESHRIFAGALGEEHVKSRKAKNLLESTTEHVTRTITDKTARRKQRRRRMPRRR